MKLVGILSAQTVLIFGLDLFFDSRLGLWLLYFLPLLGSARIPSIRVTFIGGVLLVALILVGGICKIGQVPWEEIFIPRALAVYALGLTGVLLIRGKQFGAHAMYAFVEASRRTRNEHYEGGVPSDVELARQRFQVLSQQLSEAQRTRDQELADKLRKEIEQVLEAIAANLGTLKSASSNVARHE